MENRKEEDEADQNTENIFQLLLDSPDVLAFLAGSGEPHRIRQVTWVNIIRTK